MSDFIDEYYTNLKLSLYDSVNVINLPEFENYREELISFNDYLPYLLRCLVGVGYYNNISDDVLKRVDESKFYNSEEYFVELVNWIDAHENFKSLLDEEKVTLLGNQIELLDDEFPLF